MELVFILIGLLIVLYALGEFLCRVFRGQSFWPTFKDLVKKVFDGIWDMG